MGDLSRKRKKSKEFHRPEFIPVISKDQWNTTIQASNSWRTNKCDSIFQAKSDFDEFSKNKKNIEYKTTLINTKSVDHQMPFAHSNKFFSFCFVLLDGISYFLVLEVKP